VSYTVKNWEKFQHYANRRPPWIKLHRTLLDDVAFARLHVASRALAPLLWLLASESDDGSIDGSDEDISFRLRISPKEFDAGINGLIAAGYISRLHDASTMLAPRLHDAMLETERERETETEYIARQVGRDVGGYPEEFQAFWTAYPRKVGKGAAFAQWGKIKAPKPTLETLRHAVAAALASDQWKRDGGKYIPHPATWLSQRRWEDGDAAHAAAMAARNPTAPAKQAEIDALLRKAGVEL
jgi:hypothetical protein